LFADLWEFPGGKINSRETKKAALAREFKEELGLELTSFKYVFSVTQYYTQFRAKLHVFICVPKKYPRQDKTHKWLSLKALGRYPMPSGSAKIVDRLNAARDMFL